jgi:hypothetical protein
VALVRLIRANRSSRISDSQVAAIANRPSSFREPRILYAAGLPPAAGRCGAVFSMLNRFGDSSTSDRAPRDGRYQLLPLVRAASTRCAARRLRPGDHRIFAARRNELPIAVPPHTDDTLVTDGAGSDDAEVTAARRIAKILELAQTAPGETSLTKKWSAKADVMLGGVLRAVISFKLCSSAGSCACECECASKQAVEGFRG